MSATCQARATPTSSEATATGGDPSGSVVREAWHMGGEAWGQG